MAKKKHPRGRQPQHRPRSKRPREERAGDRAEDQDLFLGLRAAMRSDHPLDLLMTVGSLMEATDPRRRDPFADRSEPVVTLADLVESFIGTPYAETTAALTVISALTTDELLRARIDRELRQRRHPLPDWLGALADATPDGDVWLLTHVLGDGDDYFIGATLPTGEALSALIYVDHNMGTIVKDAFGVPEALDDLVVKVRETIESPDQMLERIDPATARAIVEDAITTGSMMYPPVESDSWPLCRPLVEWMLRLQPAGGTPPERKEWSEQDRAAIASEFFASPYGAELDDVDGRGLLDSVLWFGTNYSTGDPYRWSPVTVEILLRDWFPRKVVAEPAFLAGLPEILRAFVRYCHDVEGITASLTAEVLAMIDQEEPLYQRTIRTARLQGPAALAARLLEADQPHDDWLDDEDLGPIGEFDIWRYLLGTLEDAVGGSMVLANLDTDPLPDEPFEWAGVPDDIRPVLLEMLDWTDRCCDEHFDVEHRTAMRRFLSRAAVGDPAPFRRKASPVRGAAAIAWVIGSANDSIGASAKVQVKDLMAWFGLKGTPSQRAEPYLRANGVDPHRRFGGMALGAADLLTSEKRASVIEWRDFWRAKQAEEDGGVPPL